MGASDGVAPGDPIEAFWPDDDEWLPATLGNIHDDGSFHIVWADGCESDVPRDYVRRLSECVADVEPIDAPDDGGSSDALCFEESTEGDPSVCEAPRPSARREREEFQKGRPLERLRGAQRDTRPAWMTKGVGVGTAILGEATGELLKPGLTKKQLEAIENRGSDSGPDPFGDVFSEKSSGRAALDGLERNRTSRAHLEEARQGGGVDSDDDAHLGEPPCFLHEELRHFSGMPGAAVDIPYDAAQNPTGSFSVDFWARPTGGSGYRSPLTSRDFPPPRGYAFFITPQGAWSFWIGLPQNNEWLKIEGPLAREGEWHRITGAYRARARTALLFVNGEKVGFKSALTSTISAFEPNTQRPLRIGGGASEAAGAKFPFVGDVQGVRVYRYPLDAPLPEHSIESTDDALSPPPAKRKR